MKTATHTSYLQRPFTASRCAGGVCSVRVWKGWRLAVTGRVDVMMTLFPKGNRVYTVTYARRLR